ncbi:glycoside hydrolase family 130 protein [Mesotoga sp. B105.6.4]|jgi:beta-1,4-mannooligosaccharide/beta-1,4-mannosyl-N-acetylglucosamine phosphorylase|uniref:glycoside hydrolase family 130 protein n=1 Tax=Mesotoga sp. B105.6.4 TaxID=1582224 RepID=UPI0015E07DCF
MLGHKLKNLPWEERPKDYLEPVWRYSKNPIITRETVRDANSIFNSAVVAYKDEFRGVFRIDTKELVMELHSGRSEDGFSWNIDQEKIEFNAEDPEIGRFVYGYDPRVVFLEDRYYITWCNGYHGPTIGVGYTYDFERFYQFENAFLPFNRNGVLFPRKIKGKFAMLSRPSDNGHTPFGDIFYSESPDMIHWGCHRHVMSPVSGWQSTKVGAGPIPIETSEGWLLIYHGVWTSCNGFVYSAGVVLLDLERPWKVIKRSKHYILNPRMPYENIGDVPNVTFPCASLQDPETGRIAIYYGAADTVTALAFTTAEILYDFLQDHSY